jgi:hypothetical protein
MGGMSGNELPPLARSHHDMGGQPAGAVERAEHDYDDWERRVDALMVLCSGITGKKRIMTVDELRKNIEALPPEVYDRLGYYEKWITSITQTLVQRGVITTEELTGRMRKIAGPRSHHDMGGLPAGKVERDEHGYAEWERRVDAMAVLAGQKGLATVDERRRAIETLPPEAYDALSYYERWVVAMGETLIERGFITSAELARKMNEVRRRG